MSITNDQLLTLIKEKKLNAEQICKKCKFSIGTLRRRYAVMTMNFRKFIDLPGLFEPENVVEMKRGGIVLSAKKLNDLESPFKLGQKFTIDISKDSMTLTAN